jgi:hypothetical protein
MTDRLRVVLELGPKGRRVVAGAIDWPGLDRWGKDEDAAIAKLVAYLPRYAGVAERAGMASEFARQTEPTIVERYPGNTSTDFWGIAHVTSETERGVLPEADLERRLDLLQATWAHFDHVAGHVSKELRHGPRGGGRTREEVIRHTLGNEPHQFAPKVEVRNPYEMAFTPDGLAVIRQMYLDGIRAYNAEGKPARSWSIQFLIRRSAQHMMDHAWELEDRDLGGG